MKAVITLPDEVHAQAELRAAELGISLSELAVRLIKQDLATFENAPGSAARDTRLDSICGMVQGPPLDMARDGKRIIAEAVEQHFTDRTR